MPNPIVVRKDSYWPSVRETVFWIMRFFSLCVCVYVCVFVCALSLGEDIGTEVQ